MSRRHHIAPAGVEQCLQPSNCCSGSREPARQQQASIPPSDPPTPRHPSCHPCWWSTPPCTARPRSCPTTVSQYSQSSGPVSATEWNSDAICTSASAASCYSAFSDVITTSACPSHLTPPCRAEGSACRCSPTCGPKGISSDRPCSHAAPGPADTLDRRSVLSLTSMSRLLAMQLKPKVRFIFHHVFCLQLMYLAGHCVCCRWLLHTWSLCQF